MFENLNFWLNVVIACVGIGALLMAFGATTVGGYLMFGGALAAYWRFMAM